MHQEIRLHGHINDSIEYFATVASRQAYRSYFFENTPDALRIFSPGNEIVLDDTRITHRGNGGSFCEYMFGVDQPMADLVKGDIRNRLVLYGATNEANGSLQFTSHTEGSQNYERVFFEGNAVLNYFFFLSGSVSGSLREQQEGIVRLLGKLLKRSDHVGTGDDAFLVDEIFGLLGHRSTLYLLKLIHKKHRIYHDAFRALYERYRAIPDAEFNRLQAMAAELGIDRYQQERIRIDVMYKSPGNRRIVDEYRNILIDCNRKGTISTLENARLTRLKTLSVRNKIPEALFYTLDGMLKHDKLVDLNEQDYISATRQILEGIFFQEQQIDASIDTLDMINLLHAKRKASENRDHTFEQILLETGKACDEKTRDGADTSLLESFSYIVTYFDRYDNASANINELSFMENVTLSEAAIRSLLGDKKAFAELDPTLFAELFFKGILENKYLGQFGRKKILCLQEGLAAIEEGRLTVKALQQRLTDIANQERLYGMLLAHVKERIRNFYSRYNTRAEQETLRSEIAEELHAKGLITEDIPEDLFQDVVVNIKKEAIYLHNLLPGIISTRDAALREDFLDNSGLDRFYVEELEREYFELNNLDMEDLYQIRKGLNG